MDALDVSEKFYDRKYEDMQDRMDKLYEEIGAIEDEIDTISMRIDNSFMKIKDDNGNVQYLCAETIDDSYADTYLTLFCNFESEGS